MKNIYVLILMTFLTTTYALAQSNTVSGTITDDENNPIPGVNIIVKGTTTGTVSDVDGKYSLQVADQNVTLVFSSIGYVREEIALNGRSVIDLALSQDITSLSEVVVVGYGTQKREDLTGSLVSAPLEAFEESPNTNVLQSLSGSVPGINIGQTSTAGEEPDIQIRGQSSINGNQEPLIVLDGIIYRGRIADINPRDIASVDVLKDASSKAVYGAQAANGVVLITTKNGKSAQKPIINYSGYYTTQTPANELTPLGREGFLKKARDIDWENGFLAPDYTQENPDWTLENDTGFFPPLLEGLANGTDYDWYDEVTDPGFITDHQLSVRGSSDKSSYFLSGGYTNQKGWMLNDKYRRVTARINVDTEITEWLTIGANTFGSFSDYSGESPQLAQLPQMSPLAAPRDENGELIINPLGDNRLNPFLQSASDDRDLRNNLSGIFYAQLRIPQIEGLSYRANFSNNYRWDALSSANPYDEGQAGRAIKINRATYDMLFDNIVNYKREFGNHHLDVTFLYGFNKINFDENRAEGTNFSNLTLSYNSLEQAVIQRIYSAAWEESYLYQMGRINYDFKNKYLLTATLRRDGFSGFSENNKFGLFPSLGLGWVLSEENFLANAANINFLKIRASYGINGNLTSRYSSLAQVSAGAESQYVFGDGGSTVNGQRMSSLSNPDLSWERTSGINLGVDFEVLNSRVSGSIDYYQSTTTDLLWNFVLPEITGFENIASNVGEISNTGLEAILNTSPVRTGNFSWDLAFNFASNNNRIETLLGLDRDGDGQEDDLIANGLFIGEPIGAIYGYVVDGIWQVDEAEEIPDGFAPGLYKLRDLDGDGNITPQGDRTILGREEPAYQFGIQNTLRYKDFAFKFFIKSIQGGNDGYLGLNNPWDGGYGTPGTAQASNWFAEIDYWTPSNPDAIYRRSGPDASIGGQRYFARNFVRLQDISLSYNLRSSLTERIGLQSLKVFISGKNLITLTDWEGWDPETGQGLGANQQVGDDNSRLRSALPVMRGFTLGLDISL
ncbi:TonB-dependent receptor [Catalinimonas sp. 4WD22]|uniref:SusC/RagA family TonB-linked outer membrane protein n=1 Tax=Catalinimonas locisalis TaxID=3133978 RepID=UPI003101741D